MRFSLCVASAVLALNIGATPMAWAGKPQQANTWTDPTTGIVFAWVPPGSFAMGCNPDLGHCLPGELPPHHATVSGFWMSITEITKGQWQKLTLNSPSKINNGDTYPIDQVNWDDVHAFLALMNKTGHGTFRLPSETEWEYACRAGSNDFFCGGNDADAVGWHLKNSKRTPMAAGQKQPNAFGLFDMSGNLWEWTQDCWSETFDAGPRDGTARTEADCASHTLRGGGWGSYPAQLRSTSRRSDFDVKCPFIGLRLVRDQE